MLLRKIALCSRSITAVMSFTNGSPSSVMTCCDDWVAILQTDSAKQHFAHLLSRFAVQSEFCGMIIVESLFERRPQPGSAIEATRAIDLTGTVQAPKLVVNTPDSATRPSLVDPGPLGRITGNTFRSRRR